MRIATSHFASLATGIGGRTIETAAAEAARSFERSCGVPGAASAFARRSRGVATIADAATLRRSRDMIELRARHRRHLARARAQDALFAAVSR